MNSLNSFFKKIIVSFLWCYATLSFAYAAQITLQAPNKALANRQPIVVLVYLDPEQDTLSGLGGDFSFQSDMFTVSDISTENSVVSLWVKQPGQSEEKYLDNRTHVTFEGIFPGGHDGVRSPYYQGKRPGILFSVTLIPKNKGAGTLLIDDITLNRFNSSATPIPTTNVIHSIVVPELLPVASPQTGAMIRVKSPTLTAFVTRTPLVDNNAWYLVVNEREGKSAIQEILVAETDDYNGELVDENKWHTAKNPYILFYQDRSKFIHVKIIYSNSTYTTFTLLPVENSTSILTISRILVGIVIVLSLMYFYVKSFFISLKKQQ